MGFWDLKTPMFVSQFDSRDLGYTYPENIPQPSPKPTKKK